MQRGPQCHSGKLCNVSQSLQVVGQNRVEVQKGTKWTETEDGWLVHLAVEGHRWASSSVPVGHLSGPHGCAGLWWRWGYLYLLR